MSTDNTIKKLNRLSNEKSPYLLQHADNPVDWYPWSEEAFKKAKEENKLIFLSVGYSTCHWCHVMAHESFENEAIAKIMNDNFVNVKAVFGGTYFPPEDQHGRPGFPSLLKRMASLWKEQGEALKKAGMDTIEQLRELTLQKSEGQTSQLNMELAHNLHQYFLSSIDHNNGGFEGEIRVDKNIDFKELGKAEERFAIMSIQEIKKRGRSLGIEFIGCDNEAQYLNKLKTVVDSRKQAAKKDLDMVKFTLKKIAMGGIHDHIGNGFHRYSTDKFWHVPHFEKMLYDQAQLLMSYVEVYLITKEPYYAEVARDIIKYVERDLRDHEGGGFYSAEDADSYPHEGAKHKLEGAFAVWEASEINEILGHKHSEIFSYHFGVKPNGNVDPSKDIQGELKKKNVLIERYTPEQTAEYFKIPFDEAISILSECKEKLAKYRFDNRPKPHRDDKILTSWNGT
ncbi:4885_t:CDS:10 [Funneliformis geosporum]|nr:4885_t:CDS:10 [Funneliformis geosporum]